MSYAHNRRRRNIAAQQAKGNVLAGREARAVYLRTKAVARLRHLAMLEQRDRIRAALDAQTDNTTEATGEEAAS